MTQENKTPTEAEMQAQIVARRKMRNWVLGGLLAFFAILFYAITVVRIGAQ